MIEFEVLSGTLDEDEQAALAQVLDSVFARPRGHIASHTQRNSWGSRDDGLLHQRVYNPGAFRTVTYF